MENIKEILLKYDRPGPRYTSYPPANFFHAGFGNTDLLGLLDESNTKGHENISIYIHIPFCSQRCHFCGCNTTVFEDDATLERYIACLIKEISVYADHLETGTRKVTQVHWGGGTPNSIEKRYILRVMDAIRSRFQIAGNAEIAIECNPAYLDLEDLQFLIDSGFNRISLGIQDFNPKVLEVVNRLPSKLPHEELMELIRSVGFTGVNYDFIYGLPMQTVESFEETIRRAISLSPDRLVTFSYAHVPWAMAPQKNLEKIGLPTPDEKLSMFLHSMDILTAGGYDQIGLDHYARPTDDLAKALHEKKLHRNFQGYCTRETTGQVYGFGCSSITQVWGGYSQNEKKLATYMDRMEKEDFAVERGYSLNMQEQLCRDTINELMCNGHLSFTEIAERFGLTQEEVKALTGYNEDKLAEFVSDSLLSIMPDGVEVSKTGMLIVRNIAMAFDPQLNTEGEKYSKTI